MAKYHVSSSGKASLCQATIKACPLGEAVHGEFQSVAEANRFAEEVTKNSLAATEQAFTVISLIKQKTSVDSSERVLEEILAKGNVEARLKSGLGIRPADVQWLKDQIAVDRYMEGEPRAKILEELYNRCPNEHIAAMVAYHRGESKEWPLPYNVGVYETDVLEIFIDQYDDDFLQASKELLKSYETEGKLPFSLKPAPERTLNKLKEQCQAVGLTVEEAVLINAPKEQLTNAKQFLSENDLELKASSELLYHGTSSSNVAKLLTQGFKKNAGAHFSGIAAGTGFYFSHDPSVAAAFSKVKEDHSDYLVLCRVVTGGDDRTQKKELAVGYRGRNGQDSSKLTKTLGRSASGKPNLSRNLTLNVAEEEPYDEVLVRDSRQIVPVALVKVKGKARRVI